MIIRVHGIPAPQGSKRHVGNGVMIESSKKVKPWREAVKWAARDALDTGGVYAFGGPVRVEVTFMFPRPKAHYRTGRNAHLLRDGAPAFPAGPPDLDKCVRSTLDALADAAVFRNDSQVTHITARKVYGDEPGATLAVYVADTALEVAGGQAVRG